MSRQTERARSLRVFRRDAEDSGFSLVEVMVAMLIFAIVAMTGLSLIVSALSATSRARTEAVAKNLGQERLEAMRNLPYAVSASVSTAVEDLLDIYYTGTTMSAPNTSSSGYVSDTGARNVAQGDPATGAFFRRILADADIEGFRGFSQRVTAQFMKDQSTVLPPTTFISSSTSTDGLPPASTIAVTVTTLWEANGKPQRFTIYSQIAETTNKPPLVTLQARLSTLRFSGVLPSARELVAEAGVVNLDGSLSNSTSASAVAQGGVATIANGARIDGAKDSHTAPPELASRPDVSAGVKTLPDSSFPSAVAQLSTSSVSGMSVGAANGMPRVGTNTLPVSASLRGGGFGSTGLVFSASNAPTTTSRLGLMGDFAQVLDPACSGSCLAVEGRGQLASTTGATHSATAKLGGNVSGTIAVLPTATSPDGLLKVTLTSFSMTCDSRAGTAPAASASLSYAGTVSYRTYDPTQVPAVYGYSAPIAISSSSTSDPLASISLQSAPGGALVGVDTTGLPLYLGDYIQSWSSLTAGAIDTAKQLASNGSSVSLSLPGVFTVTSKALRTEPESTAGLQVAAASCVAGDIR